MWYAAHIVLAYKCVNDDISIDNVIMEENIVLISAENREIAVLKAEKFLNNYKKSSGVYHFPNESTLFRSGVKKIVEISNEDLGNEENPGHGSEISYNILEFRSEQQVDKFFINDWFETRSWDSERK